MVKKGEVLFDLDPIDAKTQLDQAEKRLSISSEIRPTRLRAEVEGSIPNFEGTLIEAAPEWLYRQNLLCSGAFG